MAIKSITEFTDVNQTQCVAKSYSGGDAVAQDSTLTITYIPAGSTEGKTITSSVSGKGTETSEIECRYQKDYSELKDGDEFTRVTKTSADIVDNSSSLTVGDKEYDIADDVDDKEKSSTGYVWLRSIDDIKAVQSEFPKYKSSENVTAELSYEAAESMYNDVYDSISSKKSNTMLYVGIGAGIGVVVIAGIVVFVLLRRRA